MTNEYELIRIILADENFTDIRNNLEISYIFMHGIIDLVEGIKRELKTILNGFSMLNDFILDIEIITRKFFLFNQKIIKNIRKCNKNDFDNLYQINSLTGILLKRINDCINIIKKISIYIRDTLCDKTLMFREIQIDILEQIDYCCNKMIDDYRDCKCMMWYDENVIAYYESLIKF